MHLKTSTLKKKKEKIEEKEIKERKSLTRNLENLLIKNKTLRLIQTVLKSYHTKKREKYTIMKTDPTIRNNTDQSLTTKRAAGLTKRGENSKKLKTKKKKILKPLGKMQ
jgi:hypothetical protein